MLFYPSRHLRCLLARSALSVIAVAGTSAPAVAQSVSPADDSAAEDVGEIVVTAEKRSSTVRDIPMAISAYAPATLQQKQITSIEDIQRISPSMQAGFKVGATQFVFIRGIGAQLYQLAAEPAVAVSQDGIVNTSQNSMNLDLFDVSRVEVLRGPQGTIAGRNAIAGAVNVYSNEPTPNFEGALTATIGNYERLAVEGYLSGPIAGDKVMARLAIRSDRDNGWLRNTLLDTRLGQTDKLQFRATVLARPTDDFEALAILDVVRDRSTTFTVADNIRIRSDKPSLTEAFGAIPFSWSDKTVAMDESGSWNLRRYQPSLRLKWAVSPSTSITSLTGYLKQEVFTRWDLEGSSLPLFVWNPKATLPLFDIDQFSQELTVVSDISDRLELIAGGLYVSNHLKDVNQLGIPFDSIPVDAIDNRANQRLESISGYAQLRLKLLPNLRVSAGARYTHDRKKYDATLNVFGSIVQNQANTTWDDVTPRFTIDFTLSKDLTVYATVSKGFKSGGYVTFSAPINQFDPETAWNYEAGIKGSLFDGRLTGALTGFYMRYKGLQQSQASVSSGDIIGRVVNADTAAIKGAELELDARVTNTLRLSFSGNWLHGRYGRLLSADPVYPERGVQDYSGNRLVRAPDWQFSAGADYSTAIGSDWNATLSASYSWQTKVYFDFTNKETVAQPTYGLVNLMASLESSDGNWRVAAYLRNLTDKFYVTENYPLVERDVTYGSLTIGGPRRFGVSLTRHF